MTAGQRGARRIGGDQTAGVDPSIPAGSDDLDYAAVQLRFWGDHILADGAPDRDELTTRLAAYVMPGMAHRTAKHEQLPGDPLTAGAAHVARVVVDRLIADGTWAVR